MTADNKKIRSNYGIAEWYGRTFSSLKQSDRLRLLKSKKVICPFMHSYPAAAPREKNGKDSKIYCNKRDGVCSTRPFNKDLASGEITFGQITATCPFRFIENGTIFEAIGNKVLGTPEATLIKEVTFLNRVSQSNSANVISDQETEGPPSPKNRGREDVGRIDMVLVDPQLDPLNWCAVELQAVYFSGKAMSEDFAVMRKHEGDEFPFPPSPR